MTAVVDQEAFQDIELAAARIDDYEDEVSSMSEDSDDERSRSKTTKTMSARASSSILPRRSFYSARFESIPPVPQSFPPRPPSPKPPQSPAEQAPRQDQAEQAPRQDQAEQAPLQDQAANLGRPENSRPRPSDSNLWRAFSYDWILELTFLLVAIISLMAIILVLFLYNGHLVLDLPRVITVNAILAIFSTSMIAALSVPLTLSISQAKWDWFHHDHQGGGNPLSDLEVYDQASRGPWGALVMLGKIRWRHFSSLGAVIIVLTLAADCTIQQTISYQLRLVASPSRALRKPTLPIALGYNDTGSTHSRNLMRKAIYYGTLGIPPPISAAASCPSGECTWQAYDTLAVCSLCKNGTAGASCAEELTNLGAGPSVYISSYGPSTMTKFFNARICYSEPIVDKQSQFGRIEIEPQAGQTYDCYLSWCVRSFSSANATGGILVEDLTHIREDRVRIVSNPISSSTQPPADDNLSSSASNQSIFTVDESSNRKLFDIVNQLFLLGFSTQYTFERIAATDNGNDNSSLFTDPYPVFNNIAKAISAQLRTIPFSPSSSSSSSSSNSPPNTTTTTTASFVAPGTAFHQEPVLIVRWAWLAFPVFLLCATTSFLFLVIFTARNPVWKDSLWPLLVLFTRPRQQGAMRIGEGQGQGQGQEQGQGWGGRVGDMKRMAGVRVRLQRGGRGGWEFTLGRQEGG